MLRLTISGRSNEEEPQQRSRRNERWSIAGGQLIIWPRWYYIGEKSTIWTRIKLIGMEMKFLRFTWLSSLIATRDRRRKNGSMSGQVCTELVYVGPSSACRGDMMTYGPWWWCLVLHEERPVPFPLARRRRTGCQGRLCVMYVSLMNFQHVSKKLQRSSSSSSSSWYHRRVVARIVCKCSAMRRPKVADHEPTNSARTRFLIISRKYGTFCGVLCLFYGGDEIWLISFTLYFIAFCARLLLVHPLLLLLQLLIAGLEMMTSLGL